MCFIIKGRRPRSLTEVGLRLRRPRVASDAMLARADRHRVSLRASTRPCSRRILTASECRAAQVHRRGSAPAVRRTCSPRPIRSGPKIHDSGYPEWTDRTVGLSSSAFGLFRLAATTRQLALQRFDRLAVRVTLLQCFGPYASRRRASTLCSQPVSGFQLVKIWVTPYHLRAVNNLRPGTPTPRAGIEPPRRWIVAVRLIGAHLCGLSPMC